MSKKVRNTIIVSIIFPVILIFAIRFITNTYESTTVKAVVVKVYDNGLLAMDIKNNELYSIGFTNKGNIGFKQGQEILVYFNGTILESYPAQLGGLRKIKIINEKSNIEIPDRIMDYCYNN